MLPSNRIAQLQVKNNMNQLLCIVGSTGTGKTAKAIEIAALTPSILVSADSRQVYRGMDIVTGKDHPQEVKIYGIDIVNPDESCSVAVWYDAIMPHIQTAWNEDKLVIVVGGTGLYVRALTGGIPTMQVPINGPLRDQLSTLTVPELQEKLQTGDPTKFAQMNTSDQQNPRRLVRAIEVAQSTRILTASAAKHNAMIVGLKYEDLSEQENKIRERVMSRLKAGAVEETKKLLTQYTKDLQSMSAIGYRSIISYLEGSYTEEKMIERWIADELAYAKRQMTWFRKVDAIKWYDRNITGGEIYASTKD